MTNPDIHSEAHARCKHHLPRSARFTIAAVLLLALGAALGAGVVFATSASAHGAWKGRHSVQSVDEAREKAARGAQWLSRVVDATGAQQAELRAIATESAERLYPLIEQHRAHHEALVAELERTEIDRSALETIRVAELELANRASAELVDIVTRAAAVLDAEQREKLVELAAFAHHR